MGSIAEKAAKSLVAYGALGWRVSTKRAALVDDTSFGIRAITGLTLMLEQCHRQRCMSIDDAKALDLSATSLRRGYTGYFFNILEL